MRKVVDYKLAAFPSGNNFEASVKASVLDGWELFGPPFSHQGFCQMLVKYEGSEVTSNEFAAKLTASSPRLAEE